jgi:hypothetical protein
MRIWDIDAGFLNDKSLLGEHRELHGIVSIVRNNKTGYSRHPETRRWSRFLDGLTVRHALLVEEMSLRGFNHHSPVHDTVPDVRWPSVYIDEPVHQYEILQQKYADRNQGRIPLPRTIYDLWANHKYSVMARDYNAYKNYGRLVAAQKIDFRRLSNELTPWARALPSIASLTNAVLHMWGYVSDTSSVTPSEEDLSTLFREIQIQSVTHNVTYLIHSTALGELAYWCSKTSRTSR